MNEADFLLHGDLEWFLPHRRGTGPIHLVFEDHQSAKHLIESMGVPHVEVGEVRANQEKVSFSYHPRNGDTVEVFPPQPGHPAEACFILDNHLGRLAAFLRMLGFDSMYRNDFEDSEMVALLENDPRILLTRDRQLLMRKAVLYGYCLRSLKPKEQLAEVVRRFDLAPLVHPFTRCLRCNGVLEPVEKATVLDQLEPKTKLYYDEFARCPDCAQIYWKGSHWERMNAMVARMK